IDMTASGEKVNTTGSAITIESGVTTATIQGDGSDTINVVGSLTALSLSGQSNTVTMTGGTLTFVNGAAATVNGKSNTINETNASDVITKDSGNILNVTGSNNTATLADGSTVNVGTSSQSGIVTLTGNSFNIKENGSSSNVVTSGTGMVLDILGSNNRATVASGKITVEAGASANLSGDSNAITDRSTGTITTSGSGNTIDVVSSGAHSISMTAGSVKLESGANATITGNNDTVTLLGGNTATVTGTGETYMFGTGAGQDTIAAPRGNNTGVVDFGTNLTDENLWLVQSGNNLQIDILGTKDSLTINDWFGGTPVAAVQSFATTDGLKLDSQVAQLVSAMASYSSHNTGFNPTSATQMPSDTTLQNAIAAAWHH
ncbi:calcium-binding protein, partial [Rhizobium sp.]|uniref:calcium-binding protein n=1 Tax=Rhizobium sp. TaxID=391 RepID=UPI000E801551|nr:hypothetical protein [Rhizobium sp.]